MKRLCQWYGWIPNDPFIFSSPSPHLTAGIVSMSYWREGFSLRPRSKFISSTNVYWVYLYYEIWVLVYTCLFSHYKGLFYEELRYLKKQNSPPFLTWRSRGRADSAGVLRRAPTWFMLCCCHLKMLRVWLRSSQFFLCWAQQLVQPVVGRGTCLLFLTSRTALGQVT